MNIVLVAEESAGARTLRWLLETEHTVEAVLTGALGAPPTPVAELAAAHGVQVLPAALVRDASYAMTIRRAAVHLLLNVHSLHVVQREVLEAPLIGSFNVHPGPLPRYAGLNAPSWAIYQGETHHAVTLHWMDEGVDTGAVVSSATFEIAPDDSALAVWRNCVRLGMPLVQSLVQASAVDPAGIPAYPQDLTRRRVFGRGVPAGGRIVWQRSARELVDFTRACDYFPFASPWGHPRARFRGQDIEVLRARPTGDRADLAPGTVRRDGRTVLVATGDEWIAVERVRVASRVSAAADVLSSGDHIADG